MSNETKSSPNSSLVNLRLRSDFITSERVSGLSILLLSRHHGLNGLEPELLSFSIQQERQIRSGELLEILQSAKALRAIQLYKVRIHLSSDIKGCLTRHLLESQKVFISEPDTLKRLAIRYEQLLNWSETSAAKVIAEFDQTPVRTIHTQLHKARQLGYLQSPGQGIRSHS